MHSQYLRRHTLLNKLAARRNSTPQLCLQMKEFWNTQPHSSARINAKVHGCPIDDKEMAITVLIGLPERFNNLTSALDALGNENETFSLDFVMSRLLQEE